MSADGGLGGDCAPTPPLPAQPARPQPAAKQKLSAVRGQPEAPLALRTPNGQRPSSGRRLVRTRRRRDAVVPLAAFHVKPSMQVESAAWTDNGKRRTHDGTCLTIHPPSTSQSASPMPLDRLAALTLVTLLAGCEQPDTHVLIDAVNWVCSSHSCEVDFHVENKAHFRRQLTLQILAEQRVEVGETTQYAGLGELSQTVEVGGRQRLHVRSTIFVVRQPDRVLVTIVDEE